MTNATTEPRRRGRPPSPPTGPLTEADLTRMVIGLERLRLDEARALPGAAERVRDHEEEIARLKSGLRQEDTNA